VVFEHKIKCSCSKLTKAQNYLGSTQCGRIFTKLDGVFGKTVQKDISYE